MKTKHFKLYFFVLFSILISSCGNDDDGADDPIVSVDPTPNPDPDPDPTPDPAVVLATERKAVIDNLTANDKKVWKITEAILTNASGTFDISTNFNVTDDELIFDTSAYSSSKTEFNGTLVWRGGNAIETDVTTIEETKLDLYESPFIAAFDFVGDSSTELESSGFEFTLVDANTITGTIMGEGGSSLALSLSPKTANDYAQVPSEPLSFSQAFSYPSNGVAGFAPGMVGSNSSTSIFIVTRESGMRGTADTNPERVTRYDLTTNTLTDQLFFQGDFVSKQLHIIDNQLKVVGGQYVNTYEYSLASTPISEPYGNDIGLSRHGSAVIDSDIYLVGGGIGSIGNSGNEIFKWDGDDFNSSLEQVATMPELRSGARAEIVQNKLYIFGGTTEFYGDDAKNTIYVYDIDTNQISTETMPVNLHFTYTGKYENLIYVAAQQRTFTDDADGDGNPDGFLTEIDNEPFVGVYNTENGQFTELETNLSSPEKETIHSMAVINGKLYIIYGQPETVEEGEYQNWDVMVADID